MLRNLGRGLALALVGALGCNDVTMELLPKPPAPAAGKAGTMAGAGGEGASSPGAGMGGRPASAGMGNSANAPSDGGSDDGPPGSGACGPSGCAGGTGCDGSTNCKVCKDERDCGPGWHCDVQHFRCVECRVYAECPDGSGAACANDCPTDGTVCDWATSTCKRPCGNLWPEPCDDSETCNYDRNVCVECNYNRECVETGRGQVCLKPANVCVECTVGFDSTSPNARSANCEDPDRPICHMSDFSCRPCEDGYECGPKPWQCEAGRCKYPQSPEPPQP